MEQVLELVLPYVLDLNTLLVCSTLSQQSQQLVQEAVRLNLATLVKHLPTPAQVRQMMKKAGSKVLGAADTEQRQLLWLCRTAGPAAVNIHDNACAVLWAVENMASHGALSYNSMIAVFETLYFTTELFTHVAVQHLLLLELVVKHSNIVDVDWAVNTLAVSIATLEPDMDAIMTEPEMHELFKRVTPANLPDLLRVLASHSMYGTVSQFLLRVLEFDREHVKLLHPTADESTGQQHAAAAAAGMEAAGSDASLQRQHQQQQSPAAVLLEELLIIAFAKGNTRGVQHLCNVPCASTFGTRQLLQLVCTAALHSKPHLYLMRTSPCITASLCSLPAAQALPVGTIAAVLYRGINTRCWRGLRLLLQLPNAKQMSTQCLCGLIKAAAAAGAHELVQSLCSLAQGRRLDRRPLVDLFKLLLNASKRPDVFTTLPVDYADRHLEYLTALQPGEHLTGDDVLELLEFVTEQGLYCWGTVCWQPAASQITNVPRLARVLQGMASTSRVAEVDPVNQVAGKLPVLQQLGAADWYQVLTGAFQTGRRMLAGCAEMPGVQQLDAAQLGELLRVCIEKQLYDEVPGLLKLPATKLIMAATIEGLLQQFLLVEPSDKLIHTQHAALCWVTLLGLPQAADIPVKAVQQLHDTAFEGGFAGLAKALLLALQQQAEAVCAVTGERLFQGLLAAIERIPYGGNLWVWSEEPGLQSLGAGSCAQLVLALLQLSSVVDRGLRSGFHGLDGFPEMPFGEKLVLGQLLQLLRAVLEVRACQHMQAQDILDIVKACLGPAWCEVCDRSIAESLRTVYKYSGVVNLTTMGHIAGSSSGCCCHQVGSFLALLVVQSQRAAAQIETDQLMELLSRACQVYPSVFVWEALMRLPAAQQMTPAQVATLLSKVLSRYCTNHGSDPAAGFDVGRVVEALLQLPGGQQLSSSEVAALLVHVVQLQPQPSRTGLLAVAGQLLQHRAGQQLSCGTLAQLLQVTVWQKDFAALASMCLQHPEAASMTVDEAYHVLELLPGHWGSYDAVSQLLRLPVAQQLSLAQIKPVLWQACRFADERVCEALCALPVAAAAQADPELQVVAATGPEFAYGLVAYSENHRERGWCTCPRCRPVQ